MRRADVTRNDIFGVIRRHLQTGLLQIQLAGRTAGRTLRWLEMLLSVQNAFARLRSTCVHVIMFQTHTGRRYAFKSDKTLHVYLASHKKSPVPAEFTTRSLPIRQDAGLHCSASTCLLLQ